MPPPRSNWWPKAAGFRELPEITELYSGRTAEKCQGWSDAGIKGSVGKRDPKGKKTLDEKTATSTLEFKSKTIRLIEILPGTIHQPQYGILQTPPSEAPGIIAPLHSSFLYTRELNSLELFWFDAICINQDNITEKNHQLLWMKDLYSKLGTAANESDLAIRKIKNGPEPAQQKGFNLIWTCEEGKAIYELCD
ncbi:hypothetical protein BGZ57DRAFT_1005675 [Hyaloscypha finlandica]|nr:hypothetical protein BGZ57DRAFT_1005675 [Hyaloscypha finlandica]